MNRREFITLLGGAGVAWPLAAHAQQGTRIRQIGFLRPGPQIATAPRIAALLSGLNAVGLHENEVTFVLPKTGGAASELASMAADLVQRKVDLIAATSPAAIRTAKATTTTIPIVANDFESDPVRAGFVASFAHPGGNITGVFLDFPDFSKKWLEALNEVLPQARKVAVLWDPSTGEYQLDAVKSAADVLGITIETLEVPGTADAEAAFSKASQWGAGALLVLSSPVIGSSTKLFADLAMSHRLPAITLFTDFARDGGLMAYGPDVLAFYRQQGVMAGKILQGRPPADLPVEAPSKFQFVLNLKTAKLLNLTIPASILLRADEVIE